MNINNTARKILFLIGLAELVMICHINLVFLPLIAINTGIITAYILIGMSRQWLAISTACMFFAVLSSLKNGAEIYVPIMGDITPILHNEHIAWLILSAITALISLRTS